MDKDIKRLIAELKVVRGQLKEDYFQDEPVPEEEGQMPGGEQPDPALVQQQQQANPAMMGQGDSEEEIAIHAQEVIQHEPIIGKIRETAIEGLKKYSDHPTSSLYEFFKKVFLESDKVLTDTGNKK
jgi:hypothetical protein